MLDTVKRQDTSTLIAWRTLRKALPLRAFLEKFPHPFFVVGREIKAAAEFFTKLNTDESVDDAPSPERQVISIVKGTANPYTDRIIVGRARNCDVVLRTPGISKLHADLRLHGLDACDVADRGSTNGTFVRGKALVPGQPVALRSNDTVSFARVTCTFMSPGDLFEWLGKI